MPRAVVTWWIERYGRGKGGSWGLFVARQAEQVADREIERIERANWRDAENQRLSEFLAIQNCQGWRDADGVFHEGRRPEDDREPLRGLLADLWRRYRHADEL